MVGGSRTAAARVAKPRNIFSPNVLKSFQFIFCIYYMLTTAIFIPKFFKLIGKSIATIASYIATLRRHTRKLQLLQRLVEAAAAAAAVFLFLHYTLRAKESE